MKVLVTGGAGFIGSHLVDVLVEAGDEVSVIDSIEPQVHDNRPDYLNSRAKYTFQKVGSKSDLIRELADAEVCVHLAAAVGVGQSTYQVERYVDANVGETATLLQCLVDSKSQVRKLIVASSNTIYGEGEYWCAKCGMVAPSVRSESQLSKHEWEIVCPNCGGPLEPRPTTEGKALHPTSVYAVTKRAQEELCLTVGKAFGIPTVALRFFNVFGPRQSLGNPYTGVCAIFESRIKNRQSPLIFEDGKQSRDFVSVHDVVRACQLAARLSSADYESINVGSGKATGILEVAEVIARIHGTGVRPMVVGKYRAGDVRHCFADNRKASSLLGFQPQVSLEDGLRELVRWGDRRSAPDRLDQALAELDSRGLLKS